MNGPCAAAAFSAHPSAAHAAGESAGALLDAGVAAPDLVLVAVGPAFADHLGDIGALVTALLGPRVLVGVAAEAVIGGAELAAGPGVALLTWSAPGGAEGSSVEAVVVDEPGAAGGLDALSELRGSAVLFADPFSVDPSQMLSAVDRSPARHLAGGFVGATARRGGNRLLVGDRVLDRGIVGFTVDHRLASVVGTSGGALLGTAVTVTAAQGRRVSGIEGRPAVEVYATSLAEVGEEVDVVDAVRHGMLHLAVIGPAGAGPS